tara:strand:- start:232 stop:510 length:279 start_codon:yes stop_codon:yes gene_type:complete
MPDIFDLDGVSQVQAFANIHERLNEIEMNNNVATTLEKSLINKLHKLIDEESSPSRSRSSKKGKNRNKITRRKKMGMKKSLSKSKSSRKSRS